MKSKDSKVETNGDPKLICSYTDTWASMGLEVFDYTVATVSVTEQVRKE